MLNLSERTGPSGNRILRLNWGTAFQDIALPTSPANGETSTAEPPHQNTTEDGLTWLCRRWPGAFNTKNPRPLAIGIAEAIVAAAEADGVGAQQVLSALQFYVSRKRYLSAIAAEGAMRFDLDGIVIEPVSEGHAAHARGRLAAIDRRQRAGRDAQAARGEAAPGGFSAARRQNPPRT